jgi:hypothetical protein
MTCQNVLKSAGVNPHVIVHPLIFEKIEDSCDLLGDINSNMKAWNNYDWSLYKNIEHTNIYQLNYCDNVPIKKKLDFNYYQMAIKNFDVIYLIFLLIMTIVFLTESYLQTQSGVVFFAFFNTLLFSVNNKRAIN